MVLDRIPTPRPVANSYFPLDKDTKKLRDAMSRLQKGEVIRYDAQESFLDTETFFIEMHILFNVASERLSPARYEIREEDSYIYIRCLA